jgi:hypothetical protein
VSQIKVPWKLFGSAGWIHQPDGVVAHFHRRMDSDKPLRYAKHVYADGTRKIGACKAFVRTRELVRFGIHEHSIRGGTTCDATGSVCTVTQWGRCAVSEDVLARSYLHANHYILQSRQWFMDVKATRGAAATIINHFLRNAVYFRVYDAACNDIDDTELSDARARS